MAKREHIKTTHQPQPFIDMPLTYGDLTDHISGGSVVNNGRYAWDSNVGAYKFTQQGRSSLSNVPYVTGLNKPPTAIDPALQNFNFTQQFEIYPMTSSGGKIRMFSEQANFPTICLNLLCVINDPTHIQYLRPYEWHTCKRTLNGLASDVYYDGVHIQHIDLVTFSPNHSISLTNLVLSCGIVGDDYNNVSFCLRNIKYFEGQVI